MYLQVNGNSLQNCPHLLNETIVEKIKYNLRCYAKLITIDQFRQKNERIMDWGSTLFMGLRIWHMRQHELQIDALINKDKTIRHQ